MMANVHETPPLRVTDLLKLIPIDTQVRVDNAYKESNKKIRTALTDTNLRLAMQWESNGRRCSCRCPVAVDIGYPKKIDEEISIQDEYKLAALLSLYTPALINLRDSTDIIRRALHQSPLRNMVEILLQAKKFKSDLNKSIFNLTSCNDLATLLYQTVSEYESRFDLVKHILAVNRDILGVFSYQEGQDDPYDELRSSYAETYRADIKLYWGIIGLVSCALGVSIEGLTMVVLSHELAHAYTHLGFDRDGVRWQGQGFSQSDHELKEGLAQYYTAIVIRRLPETQRLQAQTAYDALLPKQPPAYQTHLPWLEQATPEAVGSALAVMRRRGKVTYAEFHHEVQQAVRKLKIEEGLG